MLSILVLQLLEEMRADREKAQQQAEEYRAKLTRLKAHCRNFESTWFPPTEMKKRMKLITQLQLQSAQDQVELRALRMKVRELEVKIHQQDLDREVISKIRPMSELVHQRKESVPKPSKKKIRPGKAARARIRQASQAQLTLHPIGAEATPIEPTRTL